jgi:hypothetical protein
MRIRTLSAFAAVLAVALVPSAQGMVRAPQTTEPGEIVEVLVTMTDSKITLSDYDAERGAQIDFQVKNNGRRAHNFVLRGNQAVGLSNLGLGTNLIRPKGKAVLQVFLDFRGSMIFKSTVRADQSKPGMKGTFNIE